MNLFKRGNLVTGLAVVILIFGIYLVGFRTKSPTPAVTQSVSQSQTIIYSGIEGKNALELLKASHQVETQKFDFGELVQTIDGLKPDSQHFWAFYVNGQLSQVGAGDYQTKTTDTISWKLDPIQ